MKKLKRQQGKVPKGLFIAVVVLLSIWAVVIAALLKVSFMCLFGDLCG